MKKTIGTILLWFLAVLITLFSALYQRWSGPTYPLKGKVMIDEEEIPFRLQRSETVEKDTKISIEIPDTSISGAVQYQRYPSYDEWKTFPMIREGESLKTFLPHQPPAGKLIFFVFLEKGEEKVSLSGEKPVVLRYKGDVPAAILLPHILLMFLAMLFSNRTGLEALNRRDNTYRLMLWTIALFFIGGFILGPLMQKYAFGAYWTGFPKGIDLTDNKTLIAMIAWIWAWWKNRKGHNSPNWIIIATVLMLLIYLIPHSLLGSELDYTKMP